MFSVNHHLCSAVPDREVFHSDGQYLWVRTHQSAQQFTAKGCVAAVFHGKRDLVDELLQPIHTLQGLTRYLTKTGRQHTPQLHRMTSLKAPYYIHYHITISGWGTFKYFSFVMFWPLCHIFQKYVTVTVILFVDVQRKSFHRTLYHMMLMTTWCDLMNSFLKELTFSSLSKF